MGTSIKSSKTVAICFHHVFKRHCREYLQQIKGRFHLVCQEGGSGSEESLSCRDVSFTFEAVCRCRHQQRWTCQQGPLLQADRCCSYLPRAYGYAPADSELYKTEAEKDAARQKMFDSMDLKATGV